MSVGDRSRDKEGVEGKWSAFVSFAHLLTDSLKNSLQVYLIMVAVGVTVGGLPSCWSGKGAGVCAREEGRLHGAHTCSLRGSPALGLCVGRGPASGTEGYKGTHRRESCHGQHKQ